MSTDNTPILVGTHQLISRERDPQKAQNPLEMLEEAARGATADSGVGDALLARVDTLGIVEAVGWNGGNVPKLLGERLGVPNAHGLYSQLGGEIPITLVNELAERIQRGESQVAFVGGCNNLATMTRARAAGIKLDWPHCQDGEPERIGSTKPGNSEAEQAHGFLMPTDLYPVMENALRARRDLDLASHQRNLGQLMTGFTTVAAENPYAWFPTERSAEELITVTDTNRMIGFPYPKYLNSVLMTDQAAGVVLTSVGVARELGIPEENWVYWWGGGYTAERAWFVSERPDLADSPAMKACAETVLANAQISADEISHFDFYSCFPVAVEHACEAYGVAEDDPRGHTVTGGLPYAGGPANNYTLHSVAAMAERLRENPGDVGLVTGNGWYLTKHSACVLSTRPHPTGQPTSQRSEGPLAGPEPLKVAEAPSGPARIEGYTVIYGRDGEPERGLVLGRTDAGERFIAVTPSDSELLESLVTGEAVGRTGQVSPQDGLNIFTPA